MSAFGDLIPVKSIKGKLLHKVMKPIIMNSLGYLSSIAEDIIKEKVKNNLWINPEVKMLYEILNEVIAQDKILRLPEGQYDPIRSFYENLRDTVCVILDEDSHFTLRYLLVIALIIDNSEKFRIEMHK